MASPFGEAMVAPAPTGAFFVAEVSKTGEGESERRRGDTTS